MFEPECEVCKKRSGKPFTFYKAKRGDSEVLDAGHTWAKSEVTYREMTKVQVFICSECVRQALRRDYLRKTIFSVLLGGAVAVWSIAVLYFSNWDSTHASIGFGISVPSFIIFLIAIPASAAFLLNIASPYRYFFSTDADLDSAASEKEFGERMAIERRKRLLKLYKFNATFTPEEYKAQSFTKKWNP